VTIVVGKDRSCEDSWRSGERAVLAEATNEDIHLAKIAVHEIFEQHRGDLRMVSATAQICQEEAIARLLADQLNYDLLLAETFAIGEEARDAHRDYKGKPRKGKNADQRLKDAASTSKSKAKAAAAKDPDLGGGLAQRLNDIDAVLATDRRELARAVPKLSWPDRNTVVCDCAKPKPRADKLPQLRKAVERADAAIKAAEADVAAARRNHKRAKGNLERVRREMWETSISRLSSKERMGDDEWEEWRQLSAAVAEMESSTRAEHWACEDVLSDARVAAQEARDAVDMEEIECAAARRAQALKAEQESEQSERAKLNREREQAWADLQAREAQWEALKARLPARAPSPATSSVPGARSEPKVFNLTGMSASDMRAMASSVSQAITGPLEHDESAWGPYDRAVERMRYAQPPDSESDRASECDSEHGSEYDTQMVY
jgi:hypothetical protein